MDTLILYTCDVLCFVMKQDADVYEHFSSGTTHACVVPLSSWQDSDCLGDGYCLEDI